MVTPSSPKTRSAHPKKLLVACAWPTKRFTPASYPRPSSALATPSSSPRAGWCHAARMPWSWSNTPTWETTSCASDGRSRPAAASRSRAPTSPPGKPCFAKASCSPAGTPASWRPSASPRSRSGAGRSSPFSPPGTRSFHQASRCSPPACTTPTRRCSPTRCASSDASPFVSASSMTTPKRCEQHCIRHWPAPTPCCSPAAPVRAQATPPIVSSPS